MRKHKLYNKNHTEFNGNYQLVLLLNFEVLIPEDDSVQKRLGVRHLTYFHNNKYTNY